MNAGSSRRTPSVAGAGITRQLELGEARRTARAARPRRRTRRRSRRPAGRWRRRARRCARPIRRRSCARAPLEPRSRPPRRRARTPGTAAASDPSSRMSCACAREAPRSTTRAASRRPPASRARSASAARVSSTASMRVLRGARRRPRHAPAHDVERAVLDTSAMRPSSTVTTVAPFGPVSRAWRPWRLPGNTIQRLLAHDLARVDVAERPVVVALRAQRLDRASARSGSWPSRPSSARVEEPDVERAAHARPG